MRELSKRLAAVAAFVPEGDSAADVGCDHGYIPIYLVLNGVVKRALAMDVREGPLKRAEEHIRAYGLEERIQTRLSDGLAGLREGEADTVIVAGMGGGLMVRILSGREHLKGSVHTYVLSPHSEWERVRRYLREEGFRVVREEMVEEDGKFYPILQAEEAKGGFLPAPPPSFWEEKYGPLLLAERHPVLMRYLERQEEKLELVRKELAGASGEKAVKRREQVEEELRWIRSVRREEAGSGRDAGNARDTEEERRSEMKCGEIIHKLEELAPTKYACSWDNVGLLLGRRDKEVKRLYLALDVTDRVLNEVIEGGYDMLVTHHPILFRPVSRINDDDYLGRWLLRLLSRDISCYAMHTNFDIAPGCMGDLAAERLGLRVQGPLEVTVPDEEGPKGVGRIGSMSEDITVKALCGRVKEAFGLPFVTLYSANEERLAKRIAISPGSGKGMVRLAEAAECDVLISGDFGHHDGLDAVASGISVINAGHYGLEHIFTEFLADYLRNMLGEDLVISQADILCPEKLR